MDGISGHLEVSGAMFDPSDKAQRRFAGYGPARLPDQRDDDLVAFFDDLIVGGETSAASTLATISDRAREVLRAYAVRMASLAVRRHDPAKLVSAVIANVLGGLDENMHESLMAMAPIEDAARRLSVDLPQVFEQASTIVGHPGTVNLMIWLTRKPEDRSLASMGYAAGADIDGFRYRYER
jgi:hypothetical protein